MGIFLRTISSVFSVALFTLLAVSCGPDLEANIGSVCGDDIIGADEECDDPALVEATCQSVGFDFGALRCGGECSYDTSSCEYVLQLGFSSVKQFDFSWEPVVGADYYQIDESPAPGKPFMQLGEDIVGESISYTMPLHLRFEASYRLRACNTQGCTDFAAVDVVGSLAETVGYFKASNADPSDQFGSSVALSGDHFENSNATGIDGNQGNQGNGPREAGAVYMYARDGMGQWSQEAYVKASNTDRDDWFGWTPETHAGSQTSSSDSTTRSDQLAAPNGGEPARRGLGRRVPPIRGAFALDTNGTVAYRAQELERWMPLLPRHHRSLAGSAPRTMACLPSSTYSGKGSPRHSWAELMSASIHACKLRRRGVTPPNAKSTEELT